MQKSWIWADVFRAVFAGMSWCDEGQHKSQDCMRSHVTQEALTEGPQVICAGLGLNFAHIICRNLLMSQIYFIFYFIPMFNYQTSYVGCKVSWAMIRTSICHSIQYHLRISPCIPSKASVTLNLLSCWNWVWLPALSSSTSQVLGLQSPCFT